MSTFFSITFPTKLEHQPHRRLSYIINIFPTSSPPFLHHHRLSYIITVFSTSSPSFLHHHHLSYIITVFPTSSPPLLHHHRLSCIITVFPTSSPSFLHHHRLSYIITIFPISSPSFLYHHRLSYIITAFPSSSPPFRHHYGHQAQNSGSGVARGLLTDVPLRCAGDGYWTLTTKEMELQPGDSIQYNVVAWGSMGKIQGPVTNWVYGQWASLDWLRGSVHWARSKDQSPTGYTVSGLVLIG